MSRSGTDTPWITEEELAELEDLLQYRRDGITTEQCAFIRDRRRGYEGYEHIGQAAYEEDISPRPISGQSVSLHATGRCSHDLEVVGHPVAGGRAGVVTAIQCIEMRRSRRAGNPYATIAAESVPASVNRKTVEYHATGRCGHGINSIAPPVDRERIGDVGPDQCVRMRRRFRGGETGTEIAEDTHPESVRQEAVCYHVRGDCDHEVAHREPPIVSDEHYTTPTVCARMRQLMATDEYPNAAALGQEPWTPVRSKTLRHIKGECGHDDEVPAPPMVFEGDHSAHGEWTVDIDDDRAPPAAQQLRGFECPACGYHVWLLRIRPPAFCPNCREQSAHSEWIRVDEFVEQVEAQWQSDDQRGWI